MSESLITLDSLPGLSRDELLRLRDDVCYFSERVLGFAPHKMQREIITCKERVLVVSCGRQAGKSSIMSVLLLHSALYNKNFNQFVVAGSYKNASIIFNILKKTFLQNDLIKSKVLRIVRTPNPSIEFDNGSCIQFFTVADQNDNVRGETCHRIVVDEAAFLNDSTVDTLLVPMLARHKGQLVLISTPYGRNYFYRYFQAGLKENVDGIKSFHFTSHDNPYLPPEELARIKANTPNMVWRQEYEAEFLDDAAFVYPWSLLEPCISSDFDLQFYREPGHWYVMGVDIARVKDFSAIVVLDVTSEKDIKVVWFDCFNETNSPGAGENYWEYCKEKIISVAEEFQPQRCIIDASSAGNPLFEWVKPFVPQAEAYAFANSKSNPKKVLLVNQNVLGFQQRRIRVPGGCKKLIEELRFFSFKLTEEQNMQMMAAEGHHDDCVIALCLAWSAVASPQGDVGVESFERKSKALNTSGPGDIVVLGVNPAGDVRKNSFNNPFDSDDNFGAWRNW